MDDTVPSLYLGNSPWASLAISCWCVFEGGRVAPNMSQKGAAQSPSLCPQQEESRLSKAYSPKQKIFPAYLSHPSWVARHCTYAASLQCPCRKPWKKPFLKWCQPRKGVGIGVVHSHKKEEEWKKKWPAGDCPLLFEHLSLIPIGRWQIDDR